jgi:hypothetical protein
MRGNQIHDKFKTAATIPIAAILDEHRCWSSNPLMPSQPFSENSDQLLDVFLSAETDFKMGAIAATLNVASGKEKNKSSYFNLETATAIW